MNDPLVSVVMPVYNGEKYLREAIGSILSQSYKNIELLIINDGSVDGSDEIISSYSDKRIKYINKEKNSGLVDTLNNALKIVKGKYVARMDCDDISLPRRLEKQVGFMEKNPEYGMCGTQYVHLNKDRIPHEVGAQLFDDFEIKLAIQSVNCFCHGAVMFRKSFLDKSGIKYEKKHSPYEDYELWTRITMLTKVHNLTEVLYAYMDNPEGMFLTRHKEMIEGPKILGKILQKEMPLPKASFSLLNILIDGSRKYKVNEIVVMGVRLPSNFMLAYQTFIYKLGLVYLKRKYIFGVTLLITSFSMDPLNWFKKLFGVNDTPRTKVRGIFSAFGEETVLYPRNKLRGVTKRENI